MHRAAQFVLASLGLLMASASVAAEQWIRVSDAGGGITSYEVTSRRLSGAEVLAWTHDEFREPEKGVDGAVWGQSVLNAFNCTNRTVRVVQVNTYTAPRRSRPGGTSTYTARPPRHVVPGTVGARTFQIACDADELIEAAEASGVRDQPFYWAR